MKEGEFGPYASLLYDKTFKKAFSPDTRRGKRNLLNLLNDMLEGQIPQKIKDVASQQPELNDFGSKASKSSILDLHCRDERDNKWLFIFRYLDRLKELPPALKTEKFEGLLPFAELARFNKKELKRYRYIMHLKWDRYAQELAFAEDHPDFVKKIGDEAVEKALKTIKRIMRKDGVSSDKIQTYLNVLEKAQ